MELLLSRIFTLWGESSVYITFAFRSESVLEFSLLPFDIEEVNCLQEFLC